jgi:hypothetical protein
MQDERLEWVIRVAFSASSLPPVILRRAGLQLWARFRSEANYRLSAPCLLSYPGPTLR